MNENIILVDFNDRPNGITTKLIAHEKGLLHRAFSLFVFNKKGEMLLQRRAKTKYHSGGLWTNSCCSHPIPGLEIEECMTQRLFEELGVRAFDFQEIGHFVYYRMFSDCLHEFEFDHIYKGYTNDIVFPNPDEVMEFKWVTTEWIINDVLEYPNSYTAWFVTALSIVINE